VNGAPAGRACESAKSKAADPPATSAGESTAFSMVGATGFEPATTCTPTGPRSRATSLALRNAAASLAPAPDAAVQGSQGSTAIRRNFATNLLPPIEQLLTLRQVATLLGVCRATVYKWAAAGVLPHIHIVNVIRVRLEDLTRFVTDRRRPLHLPNT
jgi:excisionase family DNA binding protein